MSTPAAPGDPRPEDAAAAPAEVLPDGGSSSLADGEWHRLHPLTPLFKGGLALIIVAGILLNTLRDRMIFWGVSLFTPEEAHVQDYGGGDPVDWVVANNLVIVALLALLGVVVVLVLAFWFVWRFQQFRITEEHVEVRKGIVFRSHRRAPLDRVQGVNLTRPFPARLIGMAKLEVVGAGTDANVPLEYLATGRAEAVRADILRLASGARAVREQRLADPSSPARREKLIGGVHEGFNGLIDGVDRSDLVPDSIVKIPTARLVGSQVMSGILWLVFFGVLFAVVMAFLVPVAIANEDGDGMYVLLGAGLGTGVPLVIAAFAITWAQISKSLRYSIAPTPDGVRITYGLFTTVTETLPPGRVFAVEVSQSLLWRPFGWWVIRINRMSGKSMSQQQSGQAQQFNVVLPVGTRADVERVLALILPDAPAADHPLVWEHGLLGPVEGDPYRSMPRRAWWRRPFSWKRHGYAVTPFALLLRRGAVWRKLAVFPLARLQGVSVAQGPIDRLQGVAWGQAHTVVGPVSGQVVGLERDDALALLEETSRHAVAAAEADHSHRWGEHAAAGVIPSGFGIPAFGPGAPGWTPAPYPPGFGQPGSGQAGAGFGQAGWVPPVHTPSEGAAPTPKHEDVSPQRDEAQGASSHGAPPEPSGPGVIPPAPR